MDIVVATNNKHKIEEFKKIIPNINFLSLDDINVHVNIDETGKTFKENSLIKAKEISKYTNKIIIADDSGLIIEAFPNLLGVSSHRFLGEDVSYHDKAIKILDMLDGKNRDAHFECVITLYNYKNEPIFFKGEIKGKIATKIDGNNGFGYDIIFIPEGYDNTFACLDESIKNKISHRAVATKKLQEYLIKEKLI